MATPPSQQAATPSADAENEGAAMVDAVLAPLTAATHSHRALPVARGMADQLGCPLHVLTSEHPAAVTDGDPMDRSWIPALAERHRVGQAEIHHHVVEDPRAAIDEVAEELGDAAVCLTTRARRVVTDALLGSTADAVVRSRRRPTVLVGPVCADDPPSRITRVVTPLDDSASSEVIVDHAARWARQLGVPLTLLHVAEPPGRGEDEPLPPELQAMMDRLHALAVSLQSEGTDADWEVIPGWDPALRLVQHLETEPTSLVAMATHGRSGLARLLLGSVTAATVRRAPSPVLTLRPHDLLDEG